MSSRRFWMQAVLAGLFGVLTSKHSWGQEGRSFNSAEIRTRNTVALEDQLTNGLRVTTPAQRSFVQLVVLRVNQGRLPRAMVNLVYNWALKRNPSVPFPYFQIALRILSRKRGIDLT